MKKLAKREEQLMQVLWKLEKAFVKEIIDELPEPKPHYNTVSTIIRILQKKGFVGHEAVGGSHQYYPLIAQEDYLEEVLDNYYSGKSYKSLVAHFAKEEKISPEELEEIIKMIKESRE